MPAQAIEKRCQLGRNSERRHALGFEWIDLDDQLLARKRFRLEVLLALLGCEDALSSNATINSLWRPTNPVVLRHCKIA
jgi:hypothetical protein